MVRPDDLAPQNPMRTGPDPARPASAYEDGAASPIPPEDEDEDVQPDIAVNRAVDETGATIEIPEDATLKAATDVEQTLGATGPTNWWRMGLIALLGVIVLLFVLQLVPIR